ncbi:hypothetical protein BGZ60DRAFT_97793 [Tricladium varicosporioides]|nr:hypothetical protein BGZ60DRAFT_97793 [Hymenoscyphus varicosporioides]
MDPYFVTPCGRYGRHRNEPFLRRRTTLEPMATPRRYYDSDATYQEGICASDEAFKAWSLETYGDNKCPRTPWFELVDRDLHLINDLVQAGRAENFKAGVQLLQLRVQAAQEADAKLQADPEGNVSMRERSQWLEDSQKGPPALIDIYNELKDERRRQEALQKLAVLCDNTRAAKTIVASPTRQPTKAPPYSTYPHPPHSSPQYRPSFGDPTPHVPSPHALESCPPSSYSPSLLKVTGTLPQDPTSSYGSAQIKSSILSLEAILPNTTSNHTSTASFKPSPHPQFSSAGQYLQQENQPGGQQGSESQYNSKNLKAVENAHIPMEPSQASQSVITSEMPWRSSHPTSNGSRSDKTIPSKPISDYRRNSTQHNFGDNSSSRLSMPKITKKLTKKLRQSTGPEKVDQSAIGTQVQEQASLAAPPESIPEYLIPAQKPYTIPPRNDSLRPKTSYGTQKETAQNLHLSQHTSVSSSDSYFQRRSLPAISKLNTGYLPHNKSTSTPDNKLCRSFSPPQQSKPIARHPSPLQQNPYHPQTRRSNNTLTRSLSPSPPLPRSRPHSRRRTDPVVPYSQNTSTPSTTPSSSIPLQTLTESLPSPLLSASINTSSLPSPEPRSTYQSLSLNPYPAYEPIPGIIIRDFAYVQRPPTPPPSPLQPSVQEHRKLDSIWVSLPPILKSDVNTPTPDNGKFFTVPASSPNIKSHVETLAPGEKILNSNLPQTIVVTATNTILEPAPNQERSLEVPKYVLNAPRTIRWRSAFRRGEVTYTSDGKIAQQHPGAEGVCDTSYPFLTCLISILLSSLSTCHIIN